jgi:xanthine dehydrogenase accessory factor
MDENLCLLVLGVGPVALTVARAALLGGMSVALYAEHFQAPEDRLSVEGVEVRLARDKTTFLAGLRQKAFIPVLIRNLANNVERWPWDVLVDARVSEGAARLPHGFSATLRIALGAGPVAGVDCDLVVVVDGPDPGALIRKGAAPARPDLRRLFHLGPETETIGRHEKILARAVVFAIEAERGGWSCPDWPPAPSDENM